MNESAIIIGAGIAGLSAGCYLQRSGYHTQIFEMHRLPGGLCTAWTRGDFTVEGCLHGLLGSDPSHPFYKLWNEMIDMSQVSFVDQEVKALFEFDDGSRFTLYADLERLERSMLEIAPEDHRLIQSFVRGTRSFQKAEMPVDKPRELYTLLDYLKLIKQLPLALTMRRWNGVLAKAFAERFHNSLLRCVVRHFASPILFEMFVLAEMDLRRCGYPICGSLEFARLLAERYHELGGQVHHSARVARILVEPLSAERHHAIGVCLADGSVHHADRIISAADGRTTLFDLLGQEYVDPEIARLYQTVHLNPSLVQIALGVGRTFEGSPATIKYILDEPLSTSDGSAYESVDVRIFHNAPGLAPEGKTLLMVQLQTHNDAYWTGLRTHDRAAYNRAKREVADQVIDLLDRKLGQIRERIEMTDIATPATYIRYTGNWHGSIQGWANENIFGRNPFKKTLPSLEGFYMAGHWVEPGGGVPNAYRSGRDLAQIICKEDRRPFVR